MSSQQSLQPVTQGELEQVVFALMREDVSESERKVLLMDCIEDPETLSRVCDWLPEAFGWLLVSQISGVQPPSTFHARDSRGQWHEIDLSSEPVFSQALKVAKDMVVSGSGDAFKKLALRSSIVRAVNSALNEGADVSGAKIAGPALVGLSAEAYGFGCLPT